MEGGISLEKIYIYKYSKKKDIETRKCNVRERSENINDTYLSIQRLRMMEN